MGAELQGCRQDDASSPDYINIHENFFFLFPLDLTDRIYDFKDVFFFVYRNI